MSPEVFFDMLFYTVSHTEQSSLSYMVSLLNSNFGVTVKKQSLNNRFNETCVLYVKAVLNEILRETFTGLYSGKLLPDFERIRIKDSTKLMVPPSLESEYKACGGDVHSRSKAGISIQYEYDLKSGEITDLNITSGDRNDRTDAGETAGNMGKGDLIIRDLGYFSTPVMEICSKKGAFFLSKVDCSTNVYDENNHLISFKKICKSMQDMMIVEKEMFVYVGKQTRIPVRLIMQLVPEVGFFFYDMRKYTALKVAQISNDQIRRQYLLFFCFCICGIIPVLRSNIYIIDFSCLYIFCGN